MKRSLCMGLLLCLGTLARAETLYVGERILLGLYEEPDSQGARLMLLQSADRVDVLERHNGFAEVRTDNGTVGWVSARYLTSDMPSSLRVAELDAEIQALRSELESAREQLRLGRERFERQQAERAASEETEPDEARIEAGAGAMLPWLAGALAIVGLLIGFAAGVWWIDRRVRNRFAGLRPY